MIFSLTDWLLDHGSKSNNSKAWEFIYEKCFSWHLIAAGQDSVTRIWSIGSGKLLHTIPFPATVDRSLSPIPALYYSEEWGGKGGMPGLLYGAGDSIYSYSYWGGVGRVALPVYHSMLVVIERNCSGVKRWWGDVCFLLVKGEVHLVKWSTYIRKNW